MTTPETPTNFQDASVVHLTYTQGTSDKFYRVYRLGDTTTQYGRTGTYGTFTPPQNGADPASRPSGRRQKPSPGNSPKGTSSPLAVQERSTTPPVKRNSTRGPGPLPPR